MTLKNISVLLTQGYTPKDIKEISDMSKDNPSIIELAKNTTNLEDLRALSEIVEEDTTGAEKTPPEGESSHTGKGQEAGESDPTPDFKDLYEKSQKEIEELKGKVEKMQSDNARRDNSGNVDPQNALDDFAKACFY